MMKRLLLLPLLLLPGVSFARPLAELLEFGGFCPGPCPTTSITIEENGAVVAITQKFAPTPSTQKRTLAVLKKEVVSAILQDAATVTKDAGLTDLDQYQPFCTDSPQTIYTVYQGDQKINVGYDRDCHQYRLSDFSGAQLAAQLRNFLTLAVYSQR